MIAAAIFLAAVFTRPMERVSTMDPAFAQSVYDSRAVALVYESPLAFDYEKRPYELVPGLCELPEVSADGLTYRFRVRDGKAATAADMVRSLERLRDPKILSPNGWMLKEVTTMRAIDERTAEIRLKRRQHVFPYLMAMSPASVRLPDGSGTGPYVLSSWRKNHAMTFTRKPSTPTPTPSTYTFSSPAPFDTIRYLVIDDISTQWLMFLKGEVDLLGELSRDNWDAVMSAPLAADATVRTATGTKTFLPNIGATLHLMPTLETAYVGINMRDPVLGPNRKLRQALNAAFDFPAWERFSSGRVLAAGGPVPPSVSGALPAESFPYRFDLAKARKLIAEAGYPGGIDPKTGRHLVLTLAIGRASQDSREAGELMASFWDRIGVKLELRFYTWDAFLKAVNEGRVQLFRMGWVGDYPDAENFLQLFHSKNRSPGPNHSDYVNAEYDREYDAAMAAETVEERLGHWRRCQEILQEDCPWVFTHFNLASSLVRPRVGNYLPSDFPYGQEAHFHENAVP